MEAAAKRVRRPLRRPRRRLHHRRPRPRLPTRRNPTLLSGGSTAWLFSGSVDALVFWFFALAWLLVLGRIAFVAVPQIVREGSRAFKRVVAIVDDSPLPLQLAKAEGDLTRVQLALDCVPQLGRRALAAIAVIRTTPLVPPAIGELIARITFEIREFQRATR